MRTRPDANGASDSPAPDSLAKALGEHHMADAVATRDRGDDFKRRARGARGELLKKNRKPLCDLRALRVKSVSAPSAPSAPSTPISVAGNRRSTVRCKRVA